MAKIGRNEKCPCQSGKKYKHCCARVVGLQQTTQVTPEQAAKITLMKNVDKIQQMAEQGKESSNEIGVFFFFSTKGGDAWLLETTECDCVQVAKDGTRLEAPIDENPEVIEVNWSHTFAIRSKVVEITAYTDKSVSVLQDAPSSKINAMIRRIRKKFSAAQLQQVHVKQPDSAAE